MEINNSPYPAAGHDTLLLTADARESLRTTVFWTKFVAIGSFIFAGLYLIFGILIIGVFGAILDLTMSESGYYHGLAGLSGGIGTFYAVTMIVWAAIFFLYGYFLVMSASRTKKSLATNDVAALESGLRYMKNFWVYNGILIIMALAIMVFVVMGLVMIGSFMGSMVAAV